MPVHNSDIAEVFDDIADLLDIKGGNDFRVRAYRNAARTVRDLSRNVTDLIEEGEDLTELPHIGDSTAEKIEEYVETGTMEKLEELRAEVPEGLRQVMDVEGLGPKRTHQLFEELGIKNLEDLSKAADAGKIAELEGFGEKTQQKILDGIERARDADHRTKFARAEELAEPLVDHLDAVDGVERVTIAGSYRRRKETVGDLDILVTCDESEDVMDAFTGYDDVEEVSSRGETRSTVILAGGFQVDLRVVEDKSYGAALHYFTGSKEHNIACRQLGVDEGYKINEYGVFEDDERIAGQTEEEIYDLLEMDWVPPELREDRGEVEAAQKGELPDLVELDDIRGELHSHTTESDGRNTLREMVEAAVEFGHDYYAVSDHSKAMTVANGLDAERLAEQAGAIDELDEEFDEITLLKSCEVDILEDGSLDLDDEALSKLDIITCSVHSHFNLSEEKQTERFLKAMDNPHCHILGHLTGRLIGSRDAYPVSVEKIIEKAAETGTMIEINSQPDRLDLDDRHAKLAREKGVKIAITTDAHATGHLRNIKYGVNQARRGWLEADDVANTRTWKQLQNLLRN